MKKIRKSLIAVVLAGAMLMGLSLTSFAAQDLVLMAFVYDQNEVCFDGLEFANGQSGTFYIPAGGWIDFYEETGTRKSTVKIYDSGKEVLSYKKNEDMSFYYEADEPTYMTATISKDGTRVDCKTKTAVVNTPSAPTQAAPATASTPSLDVNSAEQAQQLADYYAALVKKNKLSESSQEAQLAAYYKSLAKKLK